MYQCPITVWEMEESEGKTHTKSTTSTKDRNDSRIKKSSKFK